MKRKLFLLLMAIGLALENGSAVNAAPVTMPDGTIFDADYYAQAYPDVVAAVGTDVNALYNHYATYGRFEGRHPVAPVNIQSNGSATRQASVLTNPSAPNNPYAGKTITVPASGLSVDGLSYPDNASIALGNGTVLQCDANGGLIGGYVLAGATQNTIVVRYDLLTSTNGTDFSRLSADAQYVFFIRNAADAQIAGIFTNPANGTFTFPANGGSQSFDISSANQVWIIDSASGRLTPNGILPNGSYFITVGSITASSPVASNVFTVNR